MIISAFSSLIIFVGVVSSIMLLLSFRRNPPASVEAEWLTKAQFGEFEERLTGLREVIIIADIVEVPTRENAREILGALLDNFSEGVTYKFVVAEEFFNTHGDELRQRYEAILTLAGELSGTPLRPNLFSLAKRDKLIAEPDYPYVFFRYELATTPEINASEIVAFRGEELGVGIAENYRRLEPEVARSFFLSAVPHGQGPFISGDVGISFADSSKVIPIGAQNNDARKLASRAAS